MSCVYRVGFVRPPLSSFSLIVYLPKGARRIIVRRVATSSGSGSSPMGPGGSVSVVEGLAASGLALARLGARHLQSAEMKAQYEV